MPIVEASNNLFINLNTIFVIKAFFILFLVFYIFFAIMLFRQVQIMTKKLPTQLSPLLKFIGLLNVGISLALLFMVIGIF